MTELSECSYGGAKFLLRLGVSAGYFEASSQASGKLLFFRVSSAASASVVVEYLP